MPPLVLISRLRGLEPELPIVWPSQLSSLPGAPLRRVTSPLARRPDSTRSCWPALTLKLLPPSPLASVVKLTPWLVMLPPAKRGP